MTTAAHHKRRIAASVNFAEQSTLECEAVGAAPHSAPSANPAPSSCIVLERSLP
jgi:hypothetical protein